MIELDFYEVARVLDTPTTRDLGVTNTFGIVLGKAKEGATTTYAILIGDETYSLHDTDVKPTGKKVRREEVYSGEHIRVSPDGELLPTEPDSHNP
jgi:hypothetical protein